MHSLTAGCAKKNKKADKVLIFGLPLHEATAFVSHFEKRDSGERGPEVSGRIRCTVSDIPLSIPTFFAIIFASVIQ